MKHISILFLLISTICFSQKKEYSFDYALEYEITLHQDSITYNKIYLTNSKDNSYYATFQNVDSTNLELNLVHHDKLLAKVEVIKSRVNNAELVKIACKNAHKLTNKYKYQTKNYSFNILNDTVINNRKYVLYKFESHQKLKQKIRKGIGTNFYIIEPNTNFHSPVLKHPTAFEEWKLNKSVIPNGIYKELIFINPLNQQQYSEKLKKYYKIDKKILIEGDCSHLDY